MNKRSKVLGVTAGVLMAVGGCAKTQQHKPPQSVETETLDFRARCARGEFAAVYANAAQEFRTGASQADFVKTMQVLTGKLGSFQSTKPLGRKELAAGKMVTVGYQTQFARAQATELFVWRTEGAKPILVGYHVNSKDLGLY